MPIKTFTSSEIAGIEKGCIESKWPNRKDGSNRIEPVTRPKINPTFLFSKEDPIFTVGSCFARNVEAELEKNGYKVPMRNLNLATVAGKETTGIFNNYGVASILNELQWGTGEEKFDPDVHLYKTTNGKYIDLHLTSLARPSSLEACLQRRENIKNGFAQVKGCSVVIITLGLIEIWYDNEAACYLNISPPRNIRKQHPERFELHVLSHQEVLEGLFKIYQLLDRHCSNSYKSILTVSPVPLAITYTDQDVAVANAYSKATLRSAASQLVETRDNVDYYPSYESITLSDRNRAWQDDLRHPTKEMITLNVDRVLEHYGNVKKKSIDTEDIKKHIIEREFSFALNMAEHLLAEKGESKETLQLLVESASFLRERKKTDKYCEKLFLYCESSNGGWDAISVVTIMQASVRLDDMEVFSIVSGKMNQTIFDEFTLGQYRAVIKASLDLAQYDLCTDWCEKALERTPRFGYALLTRAKLFYIENDYRNAEKYLELFMSLENDPRGEGEKLQQELKDIRTA